MDGFRVEKKDLDKPIMLSNGNITSTGYYSVIVYYREKCVQRYFPRNISSREVDDFIGLAKKKLYEQYS